MNIKVRFLYYANEKERYWIIQIPFLYLFWVKLDHNKYETFDEARQAIRYYYESKI